MENEKLKRQHETKTVLDLVNLHGHGALELSPAFQRDSVWTLSDRKKLIDTVVRNYPIPAIFLYRYPDEGQLRYAVIDGKQRLETLLGFLGHLRGMTFEAKIEVPGMEGLQIVSARTLRKNGKHYKYLSKEILGYKVPVIEVEGQLSDVMELFVRLNSTGKPLTQQEKRKAKYSGSDLLVQASILANKLEKEWRSSRVMSDHHIARMKHIELAAELILSVHQGAVINKKAAIDRVMSTSTVSKARLQKASNKVALAVRTISKAFPQLRSTRFVKPVDYYTLVVLIARMIEQGAVLTDRKRQAIASDLLVAFGVEVDRMREQQRSLNPIDNERSTYRNYLLTVSQGTDNENQRRQREQILEAVIGSVFAKKDEQRGFTNEQRRILWNTSQEKKCTCCGEVLGWHNFTIDHVKPHSKGGRSMLDNAALMCRPCNSSKGNRRSGSLIGAKKTRSSARKRQATSRARST